MQTEFPFTLPRGYVDAEGNVHREGAMRLATAFDEIGPMKDPRVQANPGYLIIILMARVITTLGHLTHINPRVIESLYASDLAYLQDLYIRINQNGHNRVSIACPHCEGKFELEVERLGGVTRYPPEQLFEEVAYIAYHFHWPHEEILALEHAERQRWIVEIAKINQRFNDQESRLGY